MSFRLSTIFYVFALLAAAMATFGTWGIFAAALVLAFWAWMYSAHGPHTLAEWLVLIGIVLVIVALTLPALQSVARIIAPRRLQDKLKQLAIALDDYISQHGGLPPAFHADVNGSPLHSWRTLILSRLERANVYDKIDRDAAWDSPANRVASSTEVDQFQCESDWNPASPTDCSYFAIVGPHTAWPGGHGRPIDRNNRPEVIHNLADGSTRPPYALGETQRHFVR